ncbi:MAG: hypothetical protein OXH39_13450 [Candidatus Poribacteria bacterium]|nr:hypothetical protein [Candidatus Poribacteria bacterium]
MNQEKFEELLLNQLSEISGRMSSMDERMSSMDERMSSVENRISSLEQGMAWVRGKLEGRGGFWADIQSSIALVVAIAAIIFVWLK